MVLGICGLQSAETSKYWISWRQIFRPQAHTGLVLPFETESIQCETQLACGKHKPRAISVAPSAGESTICRLYSFTFGLCLPRCATSLGGVSS